MPRSVSPHRCWSWSPRVLQGLSAGGEFGSATCLLVEYAPAGKRGFYGSWQYFGQFFGAVLSALLGVAVTRMLSADALNAWGWRIPFLLGLVIGPIGFYIRTTLDEPPAYQHAAAADSAHPRGALAEVWRDHRPALLIAFGLVTFSTVVQFVLNVYLPAYSVQQLKLPIAVPFLVLVVTGSARMILMPLFGSLSDRVGRKPVMGTAMVLYVLVIYPLFVWLVSAPSVARLFTTELVFAVLMAAAFAPLSTVLAELLPTRVRATGMSISYNLATTIFGGTAPFMVAWLIQMTGDKMMPAYFVTAATLVGLLALWPMVDRAHAPLLEEPDPAAAAPLAN